MCGRGRSCAGEQRPTRPSLRHERSMPAVHVPEGHWHQRASAETRRGTLRASADRGEADVPRRRRSRKPQASDGRRGGRCCFERSLRPLTYRSATDAGGRAQQCDTTHARPASHHVGRGGSAQPAPVQPRQRSRPSDGGVHKMTSTKHPETRRLRRWRPGCVRPTRQTKIAHGVRNATTKAAGWLPEGSGSMVGD